MVVLLIIIYLAFISLGLPDSLMGTSWPMMHLDLAVELSAAGIVSMIVSVSTIVSSLFSTRLIARFGTGKITFFSAFLTAAAIVLVSLAPGFVWLCLLAVPLGLGAGTVDAALNNFVALHYKAKHMNWLHCFWGIGATAGPVIMSVFLQDDSSWRDGFLVIGTLQMAMALILLATLPLWKKVEGGARQAGEAQQRTVVPYRELFRKPGAKPTMLSFFCYCAVEATVGLWGASYLTMQKEVDAQTAAQWVSLYYFGITFGRLMAGFLAMKLSNKTMIRFGTVGILLGIAVLLLPLGDMVLPLGLFLIGFGCAPIFPSMLHRTPEVFGSEASQSMMGVQMACAYTGTTLMPPLFGLIAQYSSIRFFGPYVFAIALLMLVMYEWVNRKRKQATTQISQGGNEDAEWE